MPKNNKEWVEGFQIFEKYAEGTYSVTAEHDEIWAGPDSAEVSEEDLARLEELGWDISEFGNFHTFV